MKVYYTLWSLLLCLVFSANASDNTTSGNNDDFIKNSENNFEIIEDDKQLLSFEEVLKNKKLFKPFHLFKETSKPGKCIWGRFVVKFEQNQHTALIEFPDNKISDIQLFVPEKGKYKIYKAGSKYKFYERSLFHKNNVFSIDLNPNQKYVFYYRVYSSAPIYPLPWVKSYKSLFDNAVVEYSLYGVFYGCMFVILIFNIFLFIQLRGREHLFYSLYVLSIVIFSMSYSGTAFQFLWPNLQALNSVAQSISMVMIVICQMMYVKSFFHLKQNYPLLNKLFSLMIVIRIAIYIIGTAWYPAVLYNLSVEIIPLALCLAGGIYVLMQGERYARFFVLGFGLLAFSYLIFALAYFNIIPASFLTYHSLNIGAIVEIMFLTLAITDKTKVEKQEKTKAQLLLIAELQEKEVLQNKLLLEMEEKEQLKDKVNRELEEKVRQRTLEISEANVELQALTDQLNQMNSELDKTNWQLNKSVQHQKKARVLSAEVTYEEFLTFFGTETNCLLHLEELKWQNGFECKKCHNNKFNKGTQPFSRKCTRCNHIESVTAGTIFHGLKFPITKAYYMVYVTAVREKKVTVADLADLLELRLPTCWKFRQKVLERKQELIQHLKKNTIITWEDLIIINN